MFYSDTRYVGYRGLASGLSVNTPSSHTENNVSQSHVQLDVHVNEGEVVSNMNSNSKVSKLEFHLLFHELSTFFNCQPAFCFPNILIHVL